MRTKNEDCFTAFGMAIKVPNVQVSDTTGDATSAAVGLQKNSKKTPQISYCTFVIFPLPATLCFILAFPL